MIKEIDSKYCKNNFVQIEYNVDSCNLLASVNEIILLKKEDELLVNSYDNQKDRYFFSLSDKTIADGYFNELLEYNKLYLSFSANVGGFKLKTYYLYKDNNQTFLLQTPLFADKTEEHKIEISRKELERVFDYNLYDSMFMFNRNTGIRFAYNQNDGILIDNCIIPTDEEIVQMELANRKGKNNLSSFLNILYGVEEEKEEPKAKTIDEIHDFNIYGPVLFKYADMLLVSKNSNFYLYQFKLDFLEKDVFRLTYNLIPIRIPDIDYIFGNVIKYEDKEKSYLEDKMYKPKKLVKTPNYTGGMKEATVGVNDEK